MPQPAKPAGSSDPKPRGAELPPPAPIIVPPTPVVTVSPDDVIGQLLLGTPAPAVSAPAMPSPAPAASAPAPPPPPAPREASRPAPAPRPVEPTAARSSAQAPAALAATVLEPDEDRQLQAVLAAPAVATAAGREAHLATVTTQPAHQQQPPPPKPVAPRRQKPPEIPVVCKLCNTRMYARPEQVGTKMRCPDCHTENEVPAPKTAAPAAASKPAALDDQADFVLSAPPQRPAYKPIVEPRGEYAELKFLDPSAPPRQPDHPPERPPQPRAVVTETTLTYSGTPPADDDDGEEIIVSAPVERIDVKEIVKLPEPDDPDEDNQYRGTFRDDEWGFAADPHHKEAWKKSPFYYGILGFLFYPQTLFRVVLYSFVMTVDVAMFLGAIYCAQSDSPLLFAALGLTVSSSVLSAFMVAGASPCLLAIAQDTANGYDAVEHWPDWNFAEWLFQALIIPSAAFLAALPGSLLASGCFALGREGALFAPFPILFSELVLFPVIFGSMLAEGSLMPVSGAILGSMQRRGDGWLLFYCASVLLGIVLAASIALMELGIQVGTVLVAPFAAVLWVTSLTLYFRLVGRLLWYVQNYRRERDKPE